MGSFDAARGLPAAESACVGEAGARDLRGAIAYVTDVEGDFEYWNSYVDFSWVLSRGPDGAVVLADGAQFVFGGDAVDQGTGDQQVLRDLLSLKRRYPERVHLLIGNRDANKLRLRTELGLAHREAMPLREHPGTYWARNAKPSEKLSGDELDDNSTARRLRWILKETMGSPNAFEHRRAELEELGGTSEGSVDDDAVVQSFLDSMRPGGAMFEYLREARLAVVVGSALFVHAGLPRFNEKWIPGWVPAWQPGSSPSEGLPVGEWAEELDRLRASALEECVAAEARGEAPGPDAWSVVGGYVHSQPGSALLQYCMRDLPDGTRQPSVIYNGWLGDDYQALKTDDATVAWLHGAGVRFVVSGHLPHGDAPLVLQAAEGLMAITADTSYAANTKWEGAPITDSAAPCRGKAVCEVILGPRPEEARVRGVTTTGLPFEAALPSDGGILGRATADGWRVKGRVGDKVLLSRNARWSFESCLVEEDKVAWT